MELSAFGPICRLDDESTDHTLLHYPRTKLIWRMVGCHIREESSSSWLSTFLEAIHWSSVEAGGRMAYIAYYNWLSKNSLVFDAEVVLMH